MPLSTPQRQTLLWAAVAALFVAVLILLGPVLTPFAAGAVLAYALEPSVRWQSRHRVPRPLAVVLTILITLLVISAIALILIPIVQKEFAQIRTQLPGLLASLLAGLSERLLPWLHDTFGLNVSLDANSVRTWLTQHLASSGDDLAAMMFDYLKSGSSAVLQILGLVFLVPVVLFYLLLDWPSLIDRIHQLIPPRWRESVHRFTSETDSLLGQYLRGQLLVMLALAIYYSAGLLLGGFELWLPIGVLTGLLIAIPYLGFATGLVFALIAGMLQFGPLRGLVTVAIVYGAGQVIEGFFLTPRLVGKRIGLHPLAVILALLSFGLLFGFVGVLLALPLAAVLSVGLRRLRGTFLRSDFFSRG